MNELVNTNSLERIQFREKILKVQEEMKEKIAAGLLKDIGDQCVLTHYFTPIHPEYRCAAYARQIFLPRGSLVIGKVHRSEHLNFIMKGEASVNTEFGKKYFKAPCVFISEAGLKRAVRAIEDTLWVTVHLTKYNREEDLDKIEDEVIAPTYEELGLVSSTEQLEEKT